MTGSLYLIPNALGPGELRHVIPEAVLNRLRCLRYFIAENPKSARQLLKQAGIPVSLQDLHIERLDQNTPAAALPGLLAPLLEGTDGGLLSEAGCPAIADPGAPLVRLAHQSRIRVVPLVGPSSIVLALMASGLQGQRFAFHGYLPVEENPLMDKLRGMEKDSRRLDQTQIFIETPYRNDRMLRVMLRALRDTTWICVASNLSLPHELISSMPVRDWKRITVRSLKDSPTVFLLHA